MTYEQFNEFITKGPFKLGIEKLKSGFTDLLADYISAFPILIGASIPVYVLISMFSKGLAKLSVAGVFIYGGVIIIF